LIIQADKFKQTGPYASPFTSDMKAYEEIFSGDPGNIQALRELFLPDGDVGAHKWRRRRSVARA
jgi:hypothetical protein